MLPSYIKLYHCPNQEAYSQGIFQCPEDKKSICSHWPSLKLSLGKVDLTEGWRGEVPERRKEEGESSASWLTYGTLRYTGCWSHWPECPLKKERSPRSHCLELGLERGVRMGRREHFAVMQLLAFLDLA